MFDDMMLDAHFTNCWHSNYGSVVLVDNDNSAIATLKGQVYHRLCKNEHKKQPENITFSVFMKGAGEQHFLRLNLVWVRSCSTFLC